MRKALTLSIIIPAYNEERHLPACLESIAAQTVKPYEVIVVDNNSTDGTVATTKPYGFVKVVRENTQGRVWARNCGFDAAKGEIICRIDADTILPNDWLERVQGFYDQPSNLDTALTGGCYFYNIRLPNFYGWMQGQIAFRLNRLLVGHYITFGSNMAFPRRLWSQVRDQMCLRDDIHEDLDFAIHFHNAGYPITYDETLKVGIKMRRVRSQKSELWQNLMLWPQTLKVHDMKTWVFGWLGALLLYIVSPLGAIMEAIARLFGKQALDE